MDTEDILWEELWVAYDDTTRYLRCIMVATNMHFDVYDAETDTIEAEFTLLNDAREWMRIHQFIYDDQRDTRPKPFERRMTPQQKKQLSYERDSRAVPTGKGASRRVQKLMPKLRRRQVRRKMKAFLRRELTSMFRDVNDQSFRSIKSDDVPDFEKKMSLEEALKEKERRRESGEKTTRKPQPNVDTPSLSRFGNRFRRSERLDQPGTSRFGNTTRRPATNDSDLPDCLRDD